MNEDAPGRPGASSALKRVFWAVPSGRHAARYRCRPRKPVREKAGRRARVFPVVPRTGFLIRCRWRAYRPSFTLWITGLRLWEAGAGRGDMPEFFRLVAAGRHTGKPSCISGDLAAGLLQADVGPGYLCFFSFCRWGRTRPLMQVSGFCGRCREPGGRAGKERLFQSLSAASLSCCAVVSV